MIGARLSAARVLYDIVESYERDGERSPCAACGFTPKGDLNAIIRAAVAVLDRTGLGAHMSVALSKEPESELSDLTLNELIGRTEQSLSRLYALRDAEAETLGLPEAIDADTYELPEEDEPVHDAAVPIPEGTEPLALSTEVKR